MVSWVFVYTFSWNGIRSLEWLTWTYPLSIVFMFAFTLYGVTIGDRVSAGVSEYLWGKPGKKFNFWAELSHSSIWIDAATQAMYSQGVTMWTSLGSYNSPGKPVVGDALKISFYDTFYSFFAGIAIFSIYGYLTKIDFFFQNAKGLDLVFIGIPGSLIESTEYPRVWSCLFFGCFFLMLLDT